MNDEPTVPHPVQPTAPTPAQPESLTQEPATLQPEPEPKPTKRRRGGRVAVLVGALLVVLLGGAYAAGYVVAGDKLPRNASVDGIALGGLDIGQAEAKLNDEYLPRIAAPMTVTVEEAKHEVLPAESGLTVDVPATVRAGGAGKSLDPVHIWRVLTGGGPIDPVVVVDRDKVAAAVAGIAEKTDRVAVDATA
ncbi:MAG: hypothetical protein Q4G46_04625, partial [Propionibacteriaceae bacterium]|nr:hypothetical protein [Propionibacteriaceae bacterium]